MKLLCDAWFEKKRRIHRYHDQYRKLRCRYQYLLTFVIAICIMDPETVILTALRTFNTLINSMGVNVRVFMLAETNDNCYISGDMGLRVTYKRSGLKGTGIEVDLGDFNNLSLENPTILRPNKGESDAASLEKERAEKEKGEMEKAQAYIYVSNFS